MNVTSHISLIFTLTNINLKTKKLFARNLCYEYTIQQPVTASAIFVVSTTEEVVPGSL